MPSFTDNPELGIYQLPPYRLLNPEGRSPVVLVCEHASRHIPLELQRLGLTRPRRKNTSPGISAPWRWPKSFPGGSTRHCWRPATRAC